LKRIIVFDSPQPRGKENMCFDSSLDKMGNGLALSYRLGREARRRGFDILTSDVFLSKKNHDEPAYCITEMYTQYTKALLAANVFPMICFSLESPLVAHKFYYNIEQYSGRFKYSYQFLGIKKKLDSTDTIYKNIVFPVETREFEIYIPWNDRQYLVMVNSNKQALEQNFQNLKNTVLSFAKTTRLHIWKLTEPLLRVKNLYRERVNAIKYFSNSSEFHLYGFGWKDPIRGFSSDFSLAAKKCYKGTIENKRKILGNYKFTLCFENCIFPGYITEKITDCFLAGSIPVYWGASDIDDFVPPNSFIDFRTFNSFEKLNLYLSNISECEAKNYLQAGKNFILSEAFDRFDMDKLITEWLDLLPR